MATVVRIFSDNIRMNFGFSKCAYLAVKRSKVIGHADVNHPGSTIGALSISSYYKYLGVLESAEYRYTEVKSIDATKK